MLFTDEAPVDSVVADSHLSQTVQEQFSGKRLVRSVHLWVTNVNFPFQDFPTTEPTSRLQSYLNYRIAFIFALSNTCASYHPRKPT